jgi:hypothetical protein
VIAAELVQLALELVNPQDLLGGFMRKRVIGVDDRAIPLPLLFQELNATIGGTLPPTNRLAVRTLRGGPMWGLDLAAERAAAAQSQNREEYEQRRDPPRCHALQAFPRYAGYVRP